MLKTSMCGNNFFYWYCGCIAANFCLDFPCEYLKILIFKCCFFHRTQSVYIFETKFLFFRNNFTFTGSMLVGCFFSCNCTYWAARPSELKVQQQSKKVHWGAKEFSFDKIFFSSGRIKIFRGISIWTKNSNGSKCVTGILIKRTEVGLFNSCLSRIQSLDMANTTPSRVNAFRFYANL